MQNLRFITTNDQARRLNDHLLETGTHSMSLRDAKIEHVSLKVIEEICHDSRVAFSVVGIADFLKGDQQGVSLLLDADVEPIVYGDVWEDPPFVDGSEVAKCINDKMSVYRLLLQSKEIKQPRTEPIHNHRDVAEVLAKISSELVVIKPRKNGHSSQNVLILNRQRLADLGRDEVCNFHECIAQEYVPSWPPKEWRLHFVGQMLCRCLRIMDKNNWTKNFSINDVSVSDLPPELWIMAQKAAKLIASARNKDNFTLDFLETENGDFVFLEANCGALGSFYVDEPSKKRWIEPIFERIFWRYFKIRKPIS